MTQWTRMKTRVAHSLDWDIIIIIFIQKEDNFGPQYMLVNLNTKLHNKTTSESNKIKL